MPALPKRRESDGKRFHCQFFLIADLFCIQLDTFALLQPCPEVLQDEIYWIQTPFLPYIQADHSGYNYLKMPQKNYSNILNKHTTAVSCNSKNEKCQHFKFSLSNVSSYITSLSHLLGNLSPDCLGEKSSPTNRGSIPLSTLSMPWRSSDIIES